eukprot:4874520-Pleurochrysis_carterae.AAC.3
MQSHVRTEALCDCSLSMRRKLISIVSPSSDHACVRHFLVNSMVSRASTRLRRRCTRCTAQR